MTSFDHGFFQMNTRLHETSFGCMINQRHATCAPLIDQLTHRFRVGRRTCVFPIYPHTAEVNAVIRYDREQTT